ncbi:NADPH:quinone reductase [Halomarina ordinaria]|uniref:NADPH:quinone reductase n=1 Tax=Halomarina ordinaria TaxID=3033939 RepID=A0ABD5U845_9EURY|nr:NADPH:quinone reductase [Halomarina sp. PSRA2]
MRAIRYHETGGPDVLQVDDVETPDPGHGEVRIETRAAGVNPVDTYFRTGEYPPGDLPKIPGSDVAGVVDAVGAGVEGYEVGDRVYATGLGNDRQGTYAEAVLAPTDRVAHLPEAVTFAEGAAMALVGVTAWQALVFHARLEPAEVCLVHSGSGGVGHVAVQLAAATGARVVTTASERYHDHLRDLGAHTVLDYRRDDLADAVREVGRPNVVLDTIMNEYFPFDAEVAAKRARIVGIGNTDSTAPIPMGYAKQKDLRFQLMTMFNTDDTGAVLSRLAQLMAAGSVVPEIARTYPLAEAAQAQRDVLDESFLGKLLLEP